MVTCIYGPNENRAGISSHEAKALPSSIAAEENTLWAAAQFDCWRASGSSKDRVRL